MGLWLDTADVRACARLQRPLQLMVNYKLDAYEDTVYNARVIGNYTVLKPKSFLYAYSPGRVLSREIVFPQDEHHIISIR